MLNKVSLTVENDNICHNMYLIYNPATQMCLNGENNANTCEGDSGTAQFDVIQLLQVLFFKVDHSYAMAHMIGAGLFTESLHLAQPVAQVAHRLASIPVFNTTLAG